MVDVDGVLIRHPDARGWSSNLERDLGISAAGLQRVFFKPHWDDVVHGRAALRERLGPALAELSPSVSCDTFIDYWFSNDAHLDERLLDALATLREQGVEVHLATVQEHERARYLWQRLAFAVDSTACTMRRRSAIPNRTRVSTAWWKQRLVSIPGRFFSSTTEWRMSRERETVAGLPPSGRGRNHSAISSFSRNGASANVRGSPGGKLSTNGVAGQSATATDFAPHNA
jgi:hypothetical protein